MKTRSTTMLDTVKALVQVQGDLKRLSLMEKDLKAEIRAYMGTERLLEAGETCILIETRNRSDIDKDAIMHDMGADFFKKYSKRIEYDCMLIRPIAKVG